MRPSETIRRPLPLLGLLALAAMSAMAIAPRPAAAVSLTSLGSFDQPTYVDDAPGKKNRRLLFVTQKTGQVIALRNGVPLPSPFLDITDLVASNGEQGLLSIAFHPDYERNRLFYVYFTNKQGDNVVWEFKRARKSRVRALRLTGRQVLLIPHPDDAENHNGGQLQFGPDRLLYIAPGDGGSTPESAQDTNLLTGKLLRVDPRRQVARRGRGKSKGGKNKSAATKTAAGSAAVRPYGIPKGNPFIGGPGLDEIYALGLRNPYRFSFDRGSGALLIGDVGAGDREEVDYRAANSTAGVNFGWPRFEGTLLVNSSIQAPGAVPPILEYDHSGGRCVVTGGYVVRDPRLSSVVGRYVYGDFCTGEIRSFVPSPGGASGDAPLGVPAVSSLASFGEGRGGVIFLVSLEGPVYRLDP